MLDFFFLLFCNFPVNKITSFFLFFYLTLILISYFDFNLNLLKSIQRTLYHQIKTFCLQARHMTVFYVLLGVRQVFLQIAKDIFLDRIYANH